MWKSLSNLEGNHDKLVIIQLLDTVGMFLLTLKTTTTQAVKTSVTNNRISEDYFHPDDHTRQTTESFYVSKKKWGKTWNTKYCITI